MEDVKNRHHAKEKKSFSDLINVTPKKIGKICVISVKQHRQRRGGEGDEKKIVVRFFLLKNHLILMLCKKNRFSLNISKPSHIIVVHHKKKVNNPCNVCDTHVYKVDKNLA